MMLCAWEELPDNMKNKEVKHYYDWLAKHKTQLIIKRMFDVFVSVILIAILSPLFVVLAVAIKLDSCGPIFFRQVRVGQYGKPFRIFKFRSMIDGADRKGGLVTVQGDSRVTNIGKIIRKYRLDEMGQLIDVLRGTMTFVGARPEVEKYVSVYNDKMMATLLLPPGITSLASLKFCDEDVMISHSDPDGDYVNKILPLKMAFNIDEIEKINIFHDLNIILKTITHVLLRLK